MGLLHSDIQDKCASGVLDGNAYQQLCCWVELTKCYYICVRESRNLASQGVAGGFFRTTHSTDIESTINRKLDVDKCS